MFDQKAFIYGEFIFGGYYLKEFSISKIAGLLLGRE